MMHLLIEEHKIIYEEVLRRRKEEEGGGGVTGEGGREEPESLNYQLTGKPRLRKILQDK